MSKDIYVKNLSPQTTEEDLRTLFAVAGKVTYIHLVTDAKTEQFLCCAYVKMSSEAEARDAISALNEARYMNAYISVSEALPRTAPGSVRPPPQKRAARPPAPATAKKSQERSIAKGDWTGPSPIQVKKERSALPPRRKEGEAGRKGPSGDWTSAAERSIPARRKSSSPLRSAAPKKGPGPKRSK